MSAAANLTALAEYYVKAFSLPQRQAQLMRKNPTLRMMNEDKTMLGKGDAFYVTMNTHMGNSASGSFQWGMYDYAPNKAYRWLVSGPKVLYGRITLDGLALAQARNGALIDIRKNEVDNVTTHFADRIEQKLWGDSGGSIGQISATASLGGSEPARVFTLANISDVYNFDVGMLLQFSTLSTGGTLKKDAYKVTDIDLAAGTVAATQEQDNSASAPTSAAASDYIFVRGDMDTSIPGIPTFIPATAPTDTLLGIARTGKGQYLTGWRFTFQGTIEATIKTAFSVMGRFVNREQARFNVCMSFGDWLKLDDELGGRVYRTPDSSQKFGTDAILVRTPAGVVPCIAIPVMRDGRAYIIDWSTWTLHSLNALPHVNMDDGNAWLRMHPGIVTLGTGAADDSTATTSTSPYNGDGIEMRLRAWFHPVCEAPIANATFPTA